MFELHRKRLVFKRNIFNQQPEGKMDGNLGGSTNNF